MPILCQLLIYILSITSDQSSHHRNWSWNHIYCKWQIHCFNPCSSSQSMFSPLCYDSSWQKASLWATRFWSGLWLPAHTLLSGSSQGKCWVQGTHMPSSGTLLWDSALPHWSKPAKYSPQVIVVALIRIKFCYNGITQNNYSFNKSVYLSQFPKI